MAYKKDQKKAIVEDVCRQMAEEGKSLRSILKQNGMPAMSTFFSWLKGEDAESKHYARAYEDAIELRADFHFEEIFTIADSVGDDMIENEDGIMMVNHKVIQRDRLRVEARKWALARMNPKKFGDKVQVDQKVEKIKPIRLVEPPSKETK